MWIPGLSGLYWAKLCFEQMKWSYINKVSQVEGKMLQSLENMSLGVKSINKNATLTWASNVYRDSLEEAVHSAELLLITAM